MIPAPKWDRYMRSCYSVSCCFVTGSFATLPTAQDHENNLDACLCASSASRVSRMAVRTAACLKSRTRSLPAMREIDSVRWKIIAAALGELCHALTFARAFCSHAR